jgi:hypothetical protein
MYKLMRSVPYGKIMEKFEELYVLVKWHLGRTWHFCPHGWWIGEAKNLGEAWLYIPEDKISYLYMWYYKHCEKWYLLWTLQEGTLNFRNLLTLFSLHAWYFRKSAYPTEFSTWYSYGCQHRHWIWSSKSAEETIHMHKQHHWSIRHKVDTKTPNLGILKHSAKAAYNNMIMNLTEWFHTKWSVWRKATEHDRKISRKVVCLEKRPCNDLFLLKGCHFNIN